MNKPAYSADYNHHKSEDCGWKEDLCSACAFRFNCEDYLKLTNMEILEKHGIKGNQWMVSKELSK